MPPTTTPASLARDISPSPTRKSPRSRTENQKYAHASEQEKPVKATTKDDREPGLAAVEAGKTQVKDHLSYFSHHLYRASRQTPSQFPRISPECFQNLYKRNQHAQGRHFVIHQHDHPISGSFENLPSLQSSTPKLIVQGKAFTMTCDCSSPGRAP